MSEGAASIRPHREAAGLRGGDDVDDVLARLFRQGQDAWPTLPLTEEAFVRGIARRTPEPDAPLAHLGGLHAADVYLSCACNERLRGAVEAFQAAHGPTIDAALRGLGLPSFQRDELRQTMWEKLFVGKPGTPPKIGDYAGRGPLGGWVRIATIRTAQNAVKKARPHRLAPSGTGEETAPLHAPDPELAFLKSHYRVEVQRALKDALASLPADERNVLRLSFLDGLSIDRIAAVYGVHRATAARWVARGRAALLQRTHALLGERLREDPVEIERIVGLVRSQIDVTLNSLFRAPTSHLLDGCAGLPMLRAPGDRR